MSGVIILIMCAAVAVIVFVMKRVTALNDKCRNHAFIVVPIDSKTKDLERIVKSYYWEEVFENEKIGREILLVTMENSDNDFIANRLSAEYSIVHVIDITQLGEYLKDTYRCECSS